MVYEAFDRERGVSVALKCLSRGGADLLIRFKDEFRTLRDVTHPNLVRLGELHEEDGLTFFTMELLRGTDFLRHVRPEAHTPAADSGPREDAEHPAGDTDVVQRRDAGPDDATLVTRGGLAAASLGVPIRRLESAIASAFDEGRLRGALAQLAVALVELHRAGKVHRDLKPSNVMVEPDGRVVLLDFGVVAELGQVTDAEHVIVGTAAYMAPEQAAGAMPAPAADWYAVGVMLFQALTGRLPLRSNDASMLLMEKQHFDVPRIWVPEDSSVADLADLAHALLARRPEDRPTEREVLETLGIGAEGAWLSPAMLVRADTGAFVGRELELTSLLAACEAVEESGAAVTVLVEGPSGIGKSSLLEAFVAALGHEEEMLVLRARCHERESVRFKAFDGIIDGLARYLAARAAQGRVDVPPEDLSALVRVFPVLRAASDAERPKALRAAQDPVAERAKAFAAFRRLLARVSGTRRLVLVVDDLQWADADSLALLESVMRPPDAPPMLLVLTRRPPPSDVAAAPDGLAIGTVKTLVLGGLGDDEARTLVLRALGEDVVPESVELLLEEAGGHPMFLEELARQRARGLGETAPRLDEAIASRVARLPASAQRLLATIAVAGTPAPHRVISDVAELSASAYAQAVETLRAERLVRVSGLRRTDAIEPYHDRVRESAYAQLDAVQKRAIHDALAKSFVALDGDPARIAAHLARGSAPSEALPFLLRAADEARTALAFARAVRLGRDALALAGMPPEVRTDVYVALAADLEASGHAKEAADTLIDAGGDEAVPEHVRIDLTRRAAELYFGSGHLDLGADAARRALAYFGRELPASRVAAIAKLLLMEARVALSRLEVAPKPEGSFDARRLLESDVLWSLGIGLALVDSIPAVLLGTQGLLHALDIREPVRMARFLCMGSTFAAGMGRPARAERMLRAFDAMLAHGTDDSVLFYRHLAEVITTYLTENDWHRVVKSAELGREVWRRLGAARGWELAQLTQFECWSLHHMGDIPVLRERVPPFIEEAQRTGNRFLEVNFRAFFIDLALADDRPDEARRDVDEAMASWKPLTSDFNNQDFLALASRTTLAFYTGAVEDERLDREWARFDGSLLRRTAFLDQESFMHKTGLSLARARRASGRGDAKALIARARRECRKLAAFGAPATRAYLHPRLAALAALEGDEDRVVTHLRDALAAFEASRMLLWHACAAHELGRRIGGDEGRALLDAATVAFAQRGIRDPLRMTAAYLPGLVEV